MPFRITWRYVAAFLSLSLVLSEAHEQAHITVGRVVCGCYGPRDFNAWTTGDPCAHASLTVLASLAGPLFSYAVMAAGAWLLRRGRPANRGLGLALLFGPMPFARLFTALMGGGDETTALRMLFSGWVSTPALRVTGAVLVAALCAPFLLAGWRALSGRRALAFAALLAGPMLFSFVWTHTLMNRLLAGGVLDGVVLLGTPTLVLAHAAVAACVLAATWRALLGPESRRAEVVAPDAAASA